MKSTTLISLLIVAGACVLAIIGLGCASSKYGTTVGLEKPLNAYLGAYFSADAQIAEDIAEDLYKFEEATAKRINKAKLFQAVNIGQCKGKCEKSIEIKATVTDIKKVSGTSRFFLGAFAGEAYVEATVTIFDAETKESLGIYTVKGTSGSSGYSGDTSSAFDNAAKAIVKIIKENFS